MGISLRDLEFGMSFPGDQGMAARVVELIQEFTGRDLSYKNWETNDGLYMMGFALADETENPLSLPERAAIATLSWYCREYTASLKRKTSITFPKIIHSKADDVAQDNQDHLTFASEERAYMFAEVAELCFGVKSQVIETPAGWSVAVYYTNNETSQTDDVGISAETLAMLQGACRVLCSYPIAAMDNAEADPDRMERKASPEARQAWHDRKNAQADRIEDGINAILAHLGHPEAEGRESIPSTPRNVATGTKTRGIEEQIPTRPATASKKPAAKRTA